MHQLSKRRQSLCVSCTNLHRICLLLLPSLVACFFYLHQVYSLLLPSPSLLTTSPFTKSDQNLNFQMVNFSKLVVLGLFPRKNLYNISHIQLWKHDSKIVYQGNFLCLLYSFFHSLKSSKKQVIVKMSRWLV